MEFTQAEAEKKAKKRQHVLTRNDSFLSEGVPTATHGYVHYAHQLEDGVWVVDVKFNTRPIIPIPNIRKAKYEESLREINGDRPDQQ
jgi:hypothetical protein